MKKTFQLLLGILLLAAPARAEFRTWIRNDGKMAELELVKVEGTGAEAEGVFKTRKGETVKLKASVLSEGDAKLLHDWKPAGGAAQREAGDLEKFLDTRLLKLEDGKLKPLKEVPRPEKYYVFFHLDKLLERALEDVGGFYQTLGNRTVEFVLVSAKKDESDIEKLVGPASLNYPVLKTRSTEDLISKFGRGGTSLRVVTVMDLDGKIINDTISSISELRRFLKQ